jgi:hypothetical protein
LSPNKIKNPSIEALHQKEEYELVAELSHSQIKEFVKNQIRDDSKLIKYFMIYQVLMVLTGIFFLIRSLFLAFNGNMRPLIYILAAFAFCFSFLIIIHELLHAAGLKLTGAGHIRIGGIAKKFIFYAEADRHVLNRKQFAFVALIPLIVIKIASLTGIIVLINMPAIYFPIMVMSIHSLFCAGDIIMLSVFYRFPGSELFTFDITEERKSYYYKKINKDQKD